jgi:endonuclease-3
MNQATAARATTDNGQLTTDKFFMDEKQRTRAIIRRLRRAYPDAKCSLNFTNPLELLVATILSAQCTDERVNLVTADLFRKYRRACDYAAAPAAELEQAIRSTGFFRNKARAIQGACRVIAERYGGRVPRTMDELLELPGVARKTANVVLGNAYGTAAGVVVDTHVARLSQRLRLTAHEQPEKIEQDLVALVPRKDWIEFPHLLIAHGRAVCKARTPLCAECVIEEHCPSSVLRISDCGMRNDN